MYECMFSYALYCPKPSPYMYVLEIQGYCYFPSVEPEAIMQHLECFLVTIEPKRGR